jgi:ATP-binding cassette subfamily F protein 3
MLTLSGIRKAHGERVLFTEASMQVNRQDRIGLVGPNGAGKTTLFSIILGRETADEGEVTFERGVNAGYLPQENAPAGDETVMELATGITPEYVKLRRIIKAWEADHPIEALHPEEIHDDVHERFNELGGYRLEAKARQMLAGLSFRQQDFDRPARELSGGWVMRAYLARLLTQEPDLLLLDEPTNHLDLEALLWFQQYLKSYPGAIVVISHDREFLNQIVGSIVEIRQSRLIRYRGTYNDYLEQREAHEQQLLAAFKHQEREIARLMEFVNRFRAKNTKASQAQSKLKQIERMERVEAPAQAGPEIDFHFPQPQRSGLRVIQLSGIDQAYGENVVYRGMDFKAERGQRIVLVGPNGAGKSTLLKILAGVVIPQQGERNLGHNVRAGYYSQYRVDTLHMERTVLEEALDTPQRVTEQFVRTLLGCFLFRGDDVFKRVSVLSGGEKSRLALVKLLLDPPNLLLMDEPTTHLDLASVDALAYALDQFEGTLIFISHDVYFIRALANHVVHVQAGRLTHYPGGYEYYLDKTKAESERAGLTAGEGLKRTAMETSAAAGRAAAAVPNRKEQRRIEAEQRQARSRERRTRQELVQRLETEIHELESRVRALTAEMEDPSTYERTGRAQQISRELGEIRLKLPDKTVEWEAAATRLAELEADGA